MIEETQVTPLQARIAEVAQYEANIALYKTILETLPTEWPENLLQYKGAKNQHDTISGVESTDVELLSKLWYADECAKAIKTETLELTKSRAVLNVMQS
jgi:hypothetical protein